MSSHADQQSRSHQLSADVRVRFAYHPATDETGPVHDEVRENCLSLALWLIDNTPPGRHQALALTALQETCMWSNAAVAIGE